MARQVSKLFFPAIMAAILTGVIAPVAISWSAGNTCGSSTYKICVSDHDGNGVPRATTNSSDSNYSGDFYYNTTISIDNSVESMQNWFASQDVVFHTGANQSGSGFCVDSLYGYSAISIVWDNSFSSHQLGADDNAC